MNPLSEIFIMVQRELRKNFRSAKGIALFLISLLGGGAFALINTIGQRMKKQQLGDIDTEHLRELREGALTKVYDSAEIGKFLSDAPEVLWAVLMITIFCSPLLVAIMGFDGISGERQHRSVRFWAVRSRRGSYFLAKFFGLTATVSIVYLIMHLVIWMVCIFGGIAPAGNVLGWGVRFWLSSIPIVAAWSALATFLGSLFKTPIVSLLVICSTTFILFVIRLIGGAMEIGSITWVYPNKYDDLLLHPSPQMVGQGLGGLVLFVLLFTVGGTVLMNKRDV
ncbi:MAG: ABC transporter permease subunit [Polyangiaceae bacterium]